MGGTLSRWRVGHMIFEAIIILICFGGIVDLLASDFPPWSWAGLWLLVALTCIVYLGCAALLSVSEPNPRLKTDRAQRNALLFLLLAGSAATISIGTYGAAFLMLLLAGFALNWWGPHTNRTMRDFPRRLAKIPGVSSVAPDYWLWTPEELDQQVTSRAACCEYPVSTPYEDATMLRRWRRIARLSLNDRPDSGDAWIVLGHSEYRLSHFDASVRAYRVAAK